MPFERFEARPQTVEKGSEEKEDFGKEAEITIFAPLFQELKEIFPEVRHTSEEVDRKKGVDFVLTLLDRTHLALDFSIAESERVWQEKARRVLQNPMVRLIEIHPDQKVLSSRERVEESPRVLCKVRKEPIEDAYYQFEVNGRKGKPFDYLPNREELQKTALVQIIAQLEYFSSDRELVRRFPRLSQIARQRIQTLNGGVEKLLAQGRERK